MEQRATARCQALVSEWKCPFLYYMPALMPLKLSVSWGDRR
jgi:hypothetical protein